MYGSLLASCGYDRKVIIWQEINGRWGKVFEYAEHASSVNCVCWAPHSYGLMLACASSDGTISILISDETNSWRAFRIPEAHSCGLKDIMEPSSTLWSTWEDRQHHTEFIQRTTLQSRAWRTADGYIPIDRIMKTSTFDGKHGIHSTARNQLEDLDFTEDQALLSHTQEQIQVKSTSVVAASASVGLNIHK
ncbi:unnamed protein product [Schistosoma curassoni]|uniref:Protein SEC13 homolog n=1 Tax=Schistosoma curassoni TaxID=6186 RepID=A0A183JRP1_9TREM|nr:unnamed protein product [Schistosoma curassoni]